MNRTTTEGKQQFCGGTLRNYGSYNLRCNEICTPLIWSYVSLRIFVIEMIHKLNVWSKSLISRPVIQVMRYKCGTRHSTIQQCFNACITFRIWMMSFESKRNLYIFCIQYTCTSIVFKIIYKSTICKSTRHKFSIWN